MSIQMAPQENAEMVENTGSLVLGIDLALCCATIPGFAANPPCSSMPISSERSDMDLKSFQPMEGAGRAARRRLTHRDEFLLALLPTVTVLAVFALVEVVTRQRLLFATLASSAFLIYLDPEHGANTIKTLVFAQLLAATLGLLTFLWLGPGYWSGGIAMTATIALIILFDIVHPPAVSTSLIFAFRAGDESNLILFALAVGVTALLVVLERWVLWVMARSRSR